MSDKQIIIRKIPEALHRDFKTICVIEGISQQQRLLKFMIDYCYDGIKMYPTTKNKKK